MNIDELFKAVVETDEAHIVLCDINGKIVYMNQAAIRFYDYLGGEKLVGQSIMNHMGAETTSRIDAIVSWFMESPNNNRIFTYRDEKNQQDMYTYALRDDDGNLIGYYEKHRTTVCETAEPYAID